MNELGDSTRPPASPPNPLSALQRAWLSQWGLAERGRELLLLKTAPLPMPEAGSLANLMRGRGRGQGWGLGVNC